MEISDREFHRLVDYMHDNFGINLSSKRVLIQGRLGNMLRERGFTSYDQYLDAVMADTSKPHLLYARAGALHLP